MYLFESQWLLKLVRIVEYGNGNDEHIEYIDERKMKAVTALVVMASVVMASVATTTTMNVTAATTTNKLQNYIHIYM